MKFEFKNKNKKFKIELNKEDYIFWSSIFASFNYESIKSLINGFFYKKKAKFEKL